MQNILNYFSSLFVYLFGFSAYSLVISPATLLTRLSSIHSAAINNFQDSILSYWVSSLLADPGIIFSAFLWIWFAWLGFHLLLIWPFKWIRSVVKR